MASKRAVRRRLEREAKEKQELLEENGMPDSKFSGNIGRTSVADLILARTRLLKKPSIEVAKPASAPSFKGEATAAPLKTPSETKEIEDVVAKEEKIIEESIITSARHKEMIFKEGIENKDHYLVKQAEAKAKGQWRPWFYFVKKESQYSEFVMLTTEMAKELINAIWTENEGNRKLKEWLKDAYKRDIENERWIPSDESIGIDYNHIVYNGRHRMTALMESGKEWPFYITFNCLEEAKFTVDSGAKRNSSEKLRMVIDTKLGNRTTGFCKAVMRGVQSRVRYTETEIAEFAHQWEPLISWVSKNLPTARAEVQAAVGKAYLFYGPEKIEPFCERLREVKFTEDTDPARALFFALQRSKVNRINVALVAYKKTLQTIECIMTNKGLQKVFERDEDIFQWQENWELPAGAWWNNQQ